MSVRWHHPGHLPGPIGEQQAENAESQDLTIDENNLSALLQLS
jgi:hypothetical protein